jgi:hypothetical protein
MVQFINDPKLPDYNGGITNEQQAEKLLKKNQ